MHAHCKSTSRDCAMENDAAHRTQHRRLAKAKCSTEMKKERDFIITRLNKEEFI